MSERLIQLIAIITIICLTDAMAQDTVPAHAFFTALPAHSLYKFPPSSAELVQFRAAYTHKGVSYPFVMAGKDPRKAVSPTVVPTFIIPIKLVYGQSNGNRTFDPNTPAFNGMSTIRMVQASPLMKGSVHFVQGGTDVGKTQYIDAFQRANFWAIVKNKPNYHTVLNTPVVLPTQTHDVSVLEGQVATEYGKTVGLMDVNALDNLIQGYLVKFSQINPGTLPIFVTYDVYLTSPLCCIGGYHSNTAGPPSAQTYIFTTAIDQGTGVFSQDVAAMSHEIGEWMDNPFFGTNHVPCTDNSQMEVGDPLVLHDKPYTVNGFTYHLQDLVFIDYFGASSGLPVNHWLSFNNDEKNTCPGLP